MPVQNLECPNCGAPIDFAGSATTTCPFCNSHLALTDDGVKTASALNAGTPTVGAPSDRLEPAASPLGIDPEQIRQLVRTGNKIGAIKLYREQTGAGLREAKDAVEAIERGEVPAVLIEPQQRPTTYVSRRANTSRAGCLGCLPLLVFIGLCAGFILLSSQVMFRVWGPLDQVLKIVNADPNVVRVFGQPITPGPMVTGKINSGGNSSVASFSVPIYGPKQSGELDVNGSWQKGIWDLRIWVNYENSDGEEQSIKLTQKVK
jgi:hypothetical protein